MKNASAFEVFFEKKSTFLGTLRTCCTSQIFVHYIKLFLDPEEKLSYNREKVTFYRRGGISYGQRFHPGGSALGLCREVYP